MTASNWALGEELLAFGYPADVLGSLHDRPTERLPWSLPEISAPSGPSRLRALGSRIEHRGARRHGRVQRTDTQTVAPVAFLRSRATGCLEVGRDVRNTDRELPTKAPDISGRAETYDFRRVGFEPFNG